VKKNQNDGQQKPQQSQQSQPRQIYHWFKLVEIRTRKLVWEGTDLRECPTPELPIVWRLGYFPEQNRKVEDFFQLYGSENGVTPVLLDLKMIQKAKARK